MAINKVKGLWKGENKKKIIVSVFLIVFAFTGSYLIYFILQISLNTSAPMVVVVSRSMEPNINVGDLLFLQGVEDPSEIKAGTIQDMSGDVIVYDARGLWSGAPGDPIVHRVIGKVQNGSKWWFLTKGDNNNYPDPAWVPEENVIGIVIGKIPYIGYVKIFLTDTGLLIPLLVILSTLLIVSIIWDFVKKEEEQEETIEEKKRRTMHGKIEKTEVGNMRKKLEKDEEKEMGEELGYREVEHEDNIEENEDTLKDFEDLEDDFDF